MNKNLKELLLATANKNKIKEFNSLFKDFSVDILTLEHKQIEEPEETGLTFIENALLKAKYYADITSKPSLADDSGLCIDALDGFPGIYSARVAGPTRDFSIACNIIKDKLLEKGLNASKARFVCALAIYFPDGTYEVFEESIEGKILPLNGEYQGFGYEPIFIPDGYNKAFSEMKLLEKNSISHRFKSFKLFAQKYL